MKEIAENLEMLRAETYVRIQIKIVSLFSV